MDQSHLPGGEVPSRASVASAVPQPPGTDWRWRCVWCDAGQWISTLPRQELTVHPPAPPGVQEAAVSGSSWPALPRGWAASLWGQALPRVP